MAAFKLGIARAWLIIASVAGLGYLALGVSQVDAGQSGFAGMRAPLKAHLVDRAALEKAQPALVAKAVKAWSKPRRDHPQIYSLSIAAGGSQAIFGREAVAVQGMFASRLGPGAPSLVLSNARNDLYTLPLASRDNLGAVLSAIGQRIDPDRDLLLLYITAHGGPEAMVQTDLPDGTWLEPIDAKFLAAALARAGIKRRILVISACFAGSWIPALKSADTIVLTAATPDRPSFGCSDRLEFTFYGAAFINGGIGRGLSWSEAYSELQSTIAVQEYRMRLPASGPMADVGERMAAIWNAPLAPLSRR